MEGRGATEGGPWCYREWAMRLQRAMVVLLRKGHEVTEGHGGATEEGPWCYRGRAMVLQREGHGGANGEGP